MATDYVLCSDNMNFSDSEANNEAHTFLDLFSECIEKYPDKIAVSYGEDAVTYKELDIRSDHIARLLAENGVGPDIIVGVMVRRSIEMAIVILSVLKAGGAFLPIDPDYPIDRVSFILEDSGCKILFLNKALNEKLSFEGNTIYVEDIQGYTSTKELKKKYGKSSLAYILYTSGSTGRPKGVMIEHKSLVNFIDGITDIIDFNETKSTLALTTISFDIFILELLLPLTKGMKVVIASEREQKNPILLKEAIVKYNIDMLQMTPSRMQLLISYDEELSCLRNIKEIMVGGEGFPEVLLKKLQASTSARIFNMYGPTETTIWSTVSDLTEKDYVDIGKPIKNTGIYIVDIQGNLMLNGEEGELCISGDGVAKGYLNRPELTESKFVDNPFNPGQKMYRTGDLVKWLPDGNIGFIGRVDEQVKIRGFRVELGEVASYLLKHEFVKQAAVIAKIGKQGNMFLCAYYASDRELEVLDLREHMKKFLPLYMVPEMFIRVEKLPETPNQKIDKNALALL